MKVPLSEVLHHIDLTDEVRRALLSRSGPYAPTLSMVEAYERASWPVVESECSLLGIDAATMGELYVEAMHWTRERLSAAH
ncbi:MAG: hypothetical protein IT360_21745 [Gemmatimonadaceae bacterium]|nr:hypothetical protein [Gemmatimonadaceae bacterium]